MLDKNQNCLLCRGRVTEKNVALHKEYKQLVTYHFFTLVHLLDKICCNRLLELNYLVSLDYDRGTEGK